MNYLKEQAPAAYKALAGKSAGSSAFDSAWKAYAAKEPDYFARLQHNYIQASHYVPAVKSVKSATGLDVADRSAAVQDVLWSTAVQHGSAGAAKVFRNAGITSGMSDAEIIRRVYAERSADNGKKYFSSSSSAVRNGVLNRYKSELLDAMKMLT
ncbi:hypothetical protein K3T49_22845 [Paenibacillus sonchi]|nr:hypothetical protein [Paenibacillus sonchi]MCE3202466.1 hypothetical protein [Paenibacillus sonchi]